MRVLKGQSLSLFVIAIILSSCNSVQATIEIQDAYLDALPEYWKEYFEAKDLYLKRFDNVINEGVSFAFITDIHVGSNIMLNSPLLLDYLLNKHHIQKVICGGDIILDFSSKQKALSELLLWRDKTAALDAVTLLGNHDLNSNNQADKAQIISEEEFYDILCKPLETHVKYKDNCLYGYEDSDRDKVRYIYLNTGAPDSAVIDSIQLAWLQDRILQLDKEWTVVIFCHQFWTGELSKVSSLSIDENGIMIEKAINDVYDNSRATIACVISGHCHRNYSKYSDKGFPIIATTCDTGGTNSEDYDPDTPYRIKGTTTEQAIDLYYVNTLKRHIEVIRIGAGDVVMDRSFDY